MDNQSLFSALNVISKTILNFLNALNFLLNKKL